MRLFKFFSIFILIAVAGLIYRGRNPDIQSYSGKIFGTYYKIKVYSPNKISKLEKEIKETLQEVNATMSAFDPGSEISRINKAPADQPQKLSEQLSFLLKNAAKVHRESNGAFDPTVGNLVNLWGFGKDRASRDPSDKQIKEVLAYTGFKKIRFNSNYTTLQKSDPRIYIDLSAIAKGYGVDRIAHMLSREGYHDFMVEIGGEVRVSGTRDGSNPWSIGIARPDGEPSHNAFVVDLTDYAVATSGDYRNFFFRDGHRYAHTISPFDGRPVEHSLASVTVFYPDCMLADAYATAIMSLGEKKGMKMAERLRLAVILFLRHEDNLITIETSSAARRLLGE